MTIEFTEQQKHYILERHHAGASMVKIAHELGVSRDTIYRRVKIWKAEETQPTKAIPFSIVQEDDTAPILGPDLPSDKGLSVDELRQIKAKQFRRLEAYHKAQKWMPFKVNVEGPIGICFFGDPHLDDNGCDWPMLEEHVDAVVRTEHCYGINLGDTHNNWVGRLMRKYADQDTSKDTAYKLAEWFFAKSGIDWLVMLLGNHDTFTDDGARVLRRMCTNICPMVDWRAQFKLVFPNGRECLIDAAHDHKGHSQWNSLHGQERVAAFGRAPHIAIAGHRHNWAIKQKELVELEMVTWLARARGYKAIDNYAKTGGFDQQDHGHSILAVIDSDANPVNFIQLFADPLEGLEYLKFKRSKL